MPPGPFVPPSTPAVVPPPQLDAGSVDLPNLTATVHFVTPQNLAISVSVWRDGRKIYGTAAGAGALGQPVTTDMPLVLASVSKLITALTVARLAQDGRIDLTAPVPWDAMGLPHDPWWFDVTPQELLWHTSGMPVAQNSWLNLPGSCATPLADAMSLPPRFHRGTWVYSNGNYCALGLLVEHVTGQTIDAAARTLLFDPLGITGPHLTVEGLHLDDGPYGLDVRRLDRLGGAGAWMASSDDIAHLLSSVTAKDLAMLTLPGVMVDQYGWGHTGSVDGTRACAWAMEGGRTVVTAFIAGNRPGTGGKLCDVVVPALAQDLGLFAGPPVRLPD